MAALRFAAISRRKIPLKMCLRAEEKELRWVVIGGWSINGVSVWVAKNCVKKSNSRREYCEALEFWGELRFFGCEMRERFGDVCGD